MTETSGPSGPTWYDVLGVARDATPEQVRDAWRAATDRAEPGTGQFRTANQAAEVLLDPARRAAYDAQLPPEEPEAPQEPEEQPAPTEAQGPPEDGEESATAHETLETVETHETAETSRRRVRPWVPVALALVAALLTAVAVVGGLQLRAAAGQDDAAVQAPVAAEQAAEAMLSYDYRELPADRARVEPLLTGDFKASYLENFALLEEQEDGSPGAAVQSKAVVKATVVGSGLVGVDEDEGDLVARVLVFVNQTSEKEGQDPQIFQNRVAMTLVEQGDRWLVSDLRSY